MALKTSSSIAIRLLVVVVVIFLSYTILSDVGLLNQHVREDSPAAVSLNPVGAKQEVPTPSPTEELIGAYGFSDLLQSSLGASDSAFAPQVGRGESGALTRERPRQKQKAPPPSDRDESANELAAAAHPPPASPPPVPPPVITTPPKNEEPRASEDESVVVVKRVENGRVVEAHVSNPRPGREALENSALRIVRQRRYQTGVTVTETERIKIKPTVTRDQHAPQ